jgi:di/tripeptidase
MDGNHFNNNGIQAIGLAIGYSKNHTHAEQIVISDLIKGGELVKEIIKAAANQSQKRLLVSCG